LHFNPQTRVALLQPGQLRNQPVHGQRDAGVDHHGPRTPACGGGRQDLLQPVHVAATAVEQLFAIACESGHAAGLAFEQASPQVFFKGFDLAADGAGRDAERFGGGPYAAPPRDFDEHLQRVQRCGGHGDLVLMKTQHMIAQKWFATGAEAGHTRCICGRHRTCGTSMGCIW
jgi:hypothetical protein